jgi:uncharacterized membrane protein
MSSLSQTSTPAQTTRRGIRVEPWHFIILFLISAMIFAGYMSYMKLTAQQLVCDIGDGSVFNCGVVENSRWAYILGIPTAIWGFGWYSLILLSVIGQRVVPFLRVYGVPITFGMALFGFAYHCYLTYTAITVIGRLCAYCIGAHLSMTFVLLFATIELIRYMRTPAQA